MKLDNFKTAVWGCFRGSLLLIGILFLIGCRDAITSHYNNRQEAEKDDLFKRGWLPVVIPQSSRDIVTKNDLDLNTSEGEFYFNSEESEMFISHLKKIDASKNYELDWEKLRVRGYELYVFINGESKWFFCVNSRLGHCQYKMNPQANQ